MGKSTLTIGSATTGADSHGLEELYEHIHTDCIKKAITVMNENKAKVEEAIRECWSGTDEEKFEENLEKFIKQVEDALEAYDKAIQSEFSSVFQQWIDFQAKNVN